VIPIKQTQLAIKIIVQFEAVHKVNPALGRMVLCLQLCTLAGIALIYRKEGCMQ
jgi:hypothetical protein